jgi:hypothetical protein
VDSSKDDIKQLNIEQGATKEEGEGFKLFAQAIGPFCVFVRPSSLLARYSIFNIQSPSLINFGLFGNHSPQAHAGTGRSSLWPREVNWLQAVASTAIIRAIGSCSVTGGALDETVGHWLRRQPSHR